MIVNDSPNSGTVVDELALRDSVNDGRQTVSLRIEVIASWVEGEWPQVRCGKRLVFRHRFHVCERQDPVRVVPQHVTEVREVRSEWIGWANCPHPVNEVWPLNRRDMRIPI